MSDQQLYLAVDVPIYLGAGGGGRTHMLSEERGILSPVRLPIPPLQRQCISEYSRLPIPHLPECLRCTVSEN